MKPSVILIALLLISVNAIAQLFPGYRGGINHTAIQYDAAPTSTAVNDLNSRLRDGLEKLSHEPVSGYLLATLRALLHEMNVTGVVRERGSRLDVQNMISNVRKERAVVADGQKRVA